MLAANSIVSYAQRISMHGSPRRQRQGLLGVVEIDAATDVTRAGCCMEAKCESEEPSTITQGSRVIRFGHATEHQRYKQATPEGKIYYFSAFGASGEYNQSVGRHWSEYLTIGGAMIGVRYLYSDTTTSLRYFQSDHLGWISVITDDAGAARPDASVAV
jgi:hypothetical protein